MSFDSVSELWWLCLCSCFSCLLCFFSTFLLSCYLCFSSRFNSYSFSSCSLILCLLSASSFFTFNSSLSFLTRSASAFAFSASSFCFFSASNFSFFSVSKASCFFLANSFSLSLEAAAASASSSALSSDSEAESDSLSASAFSLSLAPAFLDSLTSVLVVVFFDLDEFSLIVIFTLVPALRETSFWAWCPASTDSLSFADSWSLSLSESL